MTDQTEPAPFVQPTGCLVTCLPEGHDDRWTFTVRVIHQGGGRFGIRHGLKWWSTEAGWEYEPGWPEDDETGEEAWKEAHTFDYDTAVQHACRLAPTLAYRGYTVADALAAPAA